LDHKADITKTRLHKSIPGCKVNKEDLEQLSRKLQGRVDVALGKEIDSVSGLDYSKEEIDEVIEDLRQGFVLEYTVKGVEGEDLYGKLEDVFDSPNFPDKVSAYMVDSTLPLKVLRDYTPKNNFVILLDFSIPNPGDFAFVSSMSTPNNSFFEVKGNDVSWVNGVFSELDKFFSARNSNFNFIHRHSVYDLIVWFFAFPFSMFFCFKMSGVVEGVFAESSVFIRNSIYVYIVLLSIYCVRWVFHYSRWIFPKVEYVSPLNKNTSHKIALGTIAASLSATVIYGLIGFFFSS